MQLPYVHAFAHKQTKETVIAEMPNYPIACIHIPYNTYITY